jgi:hypothetical protein
MIWTIGPVEVQRMVFTRKPLLQPKIETMVSLKLSDKWFFFRIFFLKFVLTIDIPKVTTKGK